MALKASPIAGLFRPLRPTASTSNRPCTLRVLPLRTSFFGNSGGALRVNELRLACANRLKCNAHGPTMNLFERFSRVVKSYANALLSSFEDPEKILEQTVIEMNSDLTKMRQATAQVLASQKQLENKYKASKQSSDDWYKRAQLALAKGDEDLAREALKRRKSFADNAAALKTQLDQQKGVVDNLVSNTRLLESKIQEAKAKKDTLLARARTAKTATKVQEMIGTVNTSGALSAFEKMEEKGGALRVNELRLACANRLKCNAHGPTMNLFERFSRVVKSYANALISSFEDPEKILEQTVIEMNSDLTKMRQATAQVLASQKQLENKYKASKQSSDDWYKRAQLALAKGDEDLAREALKRRKSFAVDATELGSVYNYQYSLVILSLLCAVKLDNAAALKTQLDQQKGVVDNLVSNTRLLESKIQEAKAKKDTLLARARTAKTATKVQEMIGTVNTSGALSAFEKMEEKVMAMESEADALTQIGTDELEGKFQMLETSSVDDDLAKLKNELSGGSKKGELPPGRSTVAASTGYPFKDSEIENELNELRRKANDF
ncbi:hypothetical protein F2Q69_00019949 [Brassica cretica]|uniref:PspA/IM30 family protein n=1 Tax=Brassica cretica TaxID=69181 RepID=A0A8S9PZA8_BRACR|nr:hypothetical protein F2Q69_00019949 [Brassica cretica]